MVWQTRLECVLERQSEKRNVSDSGVERKGGTETQRERRVYCERGSRIGHPNRVWKERISERNSCLHEVSGTQGEQVAASSFEPLVQERRVIVFRSRERKRKKGEVGSEGNGIIQDRGE